MKKIEQHTFRLKNINEEWDLEDLDDILSNVDSGKRLYLDGAILTPKELSLFYILTNQKEKVRSYLQLWVDMGIEHFNRCLATSDISIQLGERSFVVTPEDEEHKSRASAYEWYNLFFPTYICQYKSRYNELLEFDKKVLFKDDNAFFEYMIEFLLAIFDKNDELIEKNRQLIADMTKTGETTFIGLGGNRPMTHNRKIADMRKVLDQPIIDLFWYAYQNDEANFNTELVRYFEAKKVYIKKRKEESDWDHWVDFPALGACKYATEQGININVESNYIPAFLYKSEF